MKKGTKVLYNNQIFTIWKKEGSAARIYDPGATYPELTMQIVSIKKLQKIN